eukprot:jgi/Tetstr1/426213/TSEL_016538.t1
MHATEAARDVWYWVEVAFGRREQKLTNVVAFDEAHGAWVCRDMHHAPERQLTLSHAGGGLWKLKHGLLQSHGPFACDSADEEVPPLGTRRWRYRPEPGELAGRQGVVLETCRVTVVVMPVAELTVSGITYDNELNGKYTRELPHASSYYRSDYRGWLLFRHFSGRFLLHVRHVQLQNCLERAQHEVAEHNRPILQEREAAHDVMVQARTLEWEAQGERSVVTFGKHVGASYMTLKREQKAYCRWAAGSATSGAAGQLRSLRNWLLDMPARCNTPPPGLSDGEPPLWTEESVLGRAPTASDLQPDAVGSTRAIISMHSNWWSVETAAWFSTAPLGPYPPSPSHILESRERNAEATNCQVRDDTTESTPGVFDLAPKMRLRATKTVWPPGQDGGVEVFRTMPSAARGAALAGLQQSGLSQELILEVVKHLDPLAYQLTAN